mmetsp:Transcript_1719/g.4011  ORF Transcript_1719/g.4011 Transcript_1719/m.4011 type:complete len:325 (+) Transcript_1719:1660-2634(+)
MSTRGCTLWGEKKFVRTVSAATSWWCARDPIPSNHPPCPICSPSSTERYSALTLSKAGGVIASAPGRGASAGGEAGSSSGLSSKLTTTLRSYICGGYSSSVSFSSAETSKLEGKLIVPGGAEFPSTPAHISENLRLGGRCEDSTMKTRISGARYRMFALNFSMRCSGGRGSYRSASSSSPYSSSSSSSSSYPASVARITSSRVGVLAWNCAWKQRERRLVQQGMSAESEMRPRKTSRKGGITAVISFTTLSQMEWISEDSNSTKLVFVTKQSFSRKGLMLMGSLAPLCRIDKMDFKDMKAERCMSEPMFSRGSDWTISLESGFR